MPSAWEALGPREERVLDALPHGNRVVQGVEPGKLSLSHLSGHLEQRQRVASGGVGDLTRHVRRDCAVMARQ
jgi:hypothetical protein